MTDQQRELRSRTVIWPEGASGLMTFGYTDEEGVVWEFVLQEPLRIIPEGYAGGVVYWFRGPEVH